MSNITCSNCGNQTKSETKFCLFCGNDLEENRSKQSNADSFTNIQSTNQYQQSTEVKKTTFFCPSCMHENSLENYRCFNCNEDFKKYNIKGSVSRSRVAKVVEVAKDLERQRQNVFRSLPPVVQYVIVVISIILIAISGYFIWYFINLF